MVSSKMLCSDLEVGDKIKITPNFELTEHTIFTICRIKEIKDNIDDFYNWRQIYFKELPHYYEHLNVYDNREIKKYGIEIIELSEDK